MFSTAGSRISKHLLGPRIIRRDSERTFLIKDACQMSFPFVSHSTAGHNDVAEMINPYGNRRRGEKSGEAKAAIVLSTQRP